MAEGVVDQPEVTASVRLQWKHVLAILTLLGVGAGGSTLAFRPAAPALDVVQLEGRLVRLEEGQRYLILKVDELLRRTH